MKYQQLKKLKQKNNSEYTDLRELELREIRKSKMLENVIKYETENDDWEQVELKNEFHLKFWARLKMLFRGAHYSLKFSCRVKGNVFVDNVKLEVE